MPLSDYLGEWTKVISYNKVKGITETLDKEYSRKPVYPDKSLVFKAFNSCSYSDLKVVMIGQDPYPQKDIATGLLFGNNVPPTCENISPSLEKIKEAVIDFTRPHGTVTFDHTLQSWAQQGCLLLNSALTVEANRPGSHTMLWRPLISDLLQRLSEINTGLIYVLFGKTAQTFIPYIGKYNYILTYNHPAYAVRMGERFECDAFTLINNIIMKNNGTEITWYQEY